MIRVFRGRWPAVSPSAYVDESAQVIGDVKIGDRSSIWCNVTVRGDVNKIRIGHESNIQDNSCLHIDYNIPLIIGVSISRKPRSLKASRMANAALCRKRKLRCICWRRKST